MPVLQRLTPADAPAIVAAFCDAFRDYPVMRFIVGPGHVDGDARLTRLIDFFVFRRVIQNGPLFGMMDDGALVAAATVTLPNEPPFPDDVARRAADLWRVLGDDAGERYERYAHATKGFAIERPHHHLNMVGVRRSHAGRGLSRPLLEAVAALAREDPSSSGVSLTTEFAKNLNFYDHFGYRVIGHAQVAPDFETWGLFLDARAKEPFTTQDT